MSRTNVEVDDAVIERVMRRYGLRTKQAARLLSGPRHEQQARDLRRLLDCCRFLPLEEPSDHEAAAALYRSCRRQGTTIRRLPDWLIATVAMRINTTLLHTTPISTRSPATRTLGTVALHSDAP